MAEGTRPTAEGGEAQGQTCQHSPAPCYRDGNIGRRTIYNPGARTLKSYRTHDGVVFEYATSSHDKVGYAEMWDAWQRKVDWLFEWDVLIYEQEKRTGTTISRATRAYEEGRERASICGARLGGQGLLSSAERDRGRVGITRRLAQR